MRSFVYIFWVVLLSLASCSDGLDIQANNFVVEGFIVANEPVTNIRIKGISAIDSEEISSNPISEAQVNLLYEGITYPLTFNRNAGLFEYREPDLSIFIAEEYSLEIVVGDRVASSTTMVPNPPTGLSIPSDTLVIPPLQLNFQLRQQISDLFQEERITLEWDAVAGQSYFVVIEKQNPTIDPILPEQIPEEAVNLLSSFRFISAPSEQTSFEIIGVALESYGPHVAKVFTVNQEYLDLFENLEQDSRDLNEPPSNVSNALGIFTAFAVDSVEFVVVR